MARKARYYAGNPPADGGMWVKQPEPLHEIDGTAWELYVSGQDTDWPLLKLCAVGKAKTKANYWLAWSKSKARFVRSKSAALLYFGRPKLYATLESRLQRESIGL